jgi:hypothetical protein
MLNSLFAIYRRLMMVPAASLLVGLGAIAACDAEDDEFGPAVLTPARIDDALITDGDRQCDAEDECVIVDAECCDCRSSGNDAGRTAVNADAVASIEERRATVCSGACSSAISHDDTCCAENEAVCVNGRCEVRGVAGRNPIDDSDSCSLPPPQ